MSGGMVVKLNRYFLVCGGILALALAGCSTPAERAAWAAKRAAPQAVIVKSMDGKPVAEDTAENTPDGFPTFNAPPTAANVQINDQQAGDLQKQLTAVGAQRKAGVITEAQYNQRVAEMRRLAAEHGQDTLSQIHQQSE